MTKSFSSFRSGNDRGGKSFGKPFSKPAPWKQKTGGKPWERNTGKPWEKPTLHPATCSACGVPCQVPFKPNGKKPVLCRDCFTKDSGNGPQRFGGGDRSERPSFDKPRFGDDKPGYKKSYDRHDPQEQFAILNAKLDQILEALEELE